MMHGWTEDLSGNLAGRQPNQLLVAIETAFDIGVTRFLPSGRKEWPNLNVTCLTPGVVGAVVVGLRAPGLAAFVIDIAQFVYPNDPRPRWKPGVHLFVVQLVPTRVQLKAATLATAFIDANVPVVDFKFEDMPPFIDSNEG